MSYTDKTLLCKDCGQEFLFSAGEQEFFASRGFVNQPQRCTACRAAYRARVGGDSARDSAGRPVRDMHPVICAQCGVETLVPFLPRLDKPVYCSSCFAQMRSNNMASATV